MKKDSKRWRGGGGDGGFDITAYWQYDNNSNTVTIVMIINFFRFF